MPVSAELLEAINREMQHIPISQGRWPELVLEFTQLRAAAEASLRAHDFDRDPTEFLALLRATRT